MTERIRVAVAFIIGSLGLLLVYWPALNGGFIWDDVLHLRDTPPIQATDGLFRIWLTTECRDYYPLAYSAFWLEWHLWGWRTAGFHLVNVLLHTAGAVILWRVLKCLDIPCAWLGALLFAVHPVNVSSVAWISELKNVLAFPLAALAVVAYLSERRWVALACFVGSLLAKPAAVGLPAVLLAVTWWRTGRLEKRDWLSIAPFAAVAGLMGVVTIWFQHHRALEGRAVLTSSLPERIAAASAVVWFYLLKAVAPLGLSTVYSPWPKSWNLIALVTGVALTTILWRQRDRWGRGWFAALVCFVALLFPVLGFFDQGYYRFSPVADHWQYFALPVVCIGAGFVAGRFRGCGLVALALAGGLAIASSQRSQAFKSDEQFWRSTLAENPRAWIAEYSLGNHLAQRQDPSALAHYQRAELLDPGYAPSHYNAAILLATQGRFAKAVASMEQACRLEPERADWHRKLAQLYLEVHQPDRAVAEFREALRLNPSDSEARRALETLRDGS